MNTLLKFFRNSDLVHICGKLIVVGIDENGDEIKRYDNQAMAPVSQLNTILTDQHMQFCINPLTPHNRNLKGARNHRAGVNVAAYRNFLLESDSLPIELQKEIMPKLVETLPVTAVIYSGGKSLHYIISINDDLNCGVPGSDEANGRYKMYWRGLETTFTDAVRQLIPNAGSAIFDASTKDVVKLARLPGATRNNGVKQELLYEGRLVPADEIYELATKVERQARGPVVNANPSMDLKRFEAELLLQKNSALYLKFNSAHIWAAEAGMYHEVFKLALWAADATGVPYETLEFYLQNKVYPAIINKGYRRDPSIGTFNAFKWKNLI